MDGLRDFQRHRVKTINDAAFVQLAALRGSQPQRVFLLAVSHFVGTFAHAFTQHFFCGLGAE